MRNLAKIKPMVNEPYRMKNLSSSIFAPMQSVVWNLSTDKRRILLLAKVKTREEGDEKCKSGLDPKPLEVCQDRG